MGNMNLMNVVGLKNKSSPLSKLKIKGKEKVSFLSVMKSISEKNLKDEKERNLKNTMVLSAPFMFIVQNEAKRNHFKHNPLLSHVVSKEKNGYPGIIKSIAIESQDKESHDFVVKFDKTKLSDKKEDVDFAFSAKKANVKAKGVPEIKTEFVLPKIKSVMKSIVYAKNLKPVKKEVKSPYINNLKKEDVKLKDRNDNIVQNAINGVNYKKMEGLGKVESPLLKKIHRENGNSKLILNKVIYKKETMITSNIRSENIRLKLVKKVEKTDLKNIKSIKKEHKTIKERTESEKLKFKDDVVSNIEAQKKSGHSKKGNITTILHKVKADKSKIKTIKIDVNPIIKEVRKEFSKSDVRKPSKVEVKDSLNTISVYSDKKTDSKRKTFMSAYKSVSDRIEMKEEKDIGIEETKDTVIKHESKSIRPYNMTILSHRTADILQKKVSDLPVVKMNYADIKSFFNEELKSLKGSVKFPTQRESVIELNPPDMGRIKVLITMKSEDNVEVKVFTQKESTMPVMNSVIHDIEKDLVKDNVNMKYVVLPWNDQNQQKNQSFYQKSKKKGTPSFKGVLREASVDIHI